MWKQNKRPLTGWKLLQREEKKSCDSQRAQKLVSTSSWNIDERFIVSIALRWNICQISQRVLARSTSSQWTPSISTNYCFSSVTSVVSTWKWIQIQNKNWIQHYGAAAVKGLGDSSELWIGPRLRRTDSRILLARQWFYFRFAARDTSVCFPTYALKISSVVFLEEGETAINSASPNRALDKLQQKKKQKWWLVEKPDYHNAVIW